MSFESEFTTCMHGSRLPTPAEAIGSAEEVLEFLEQLHTAAEAAGGMEATLVGLEAEGLFAAVGPIASDAAAVTAAAYAGATAGCLIAATGSAVFELLAANDYSQTVQNEVVAAAVESGVEVPERYEVG